jgi:hypothetical protein
MERALKDRGRSDWKQQRQIKYATVRHVARIGKIKPRSSHKLGFISTKGTGSSGAGNRAKKKAEGGAFHEKRNKGAYDRTGSAAEQYGLTAGGTAQLSKTKKWTASGGQELKPKRDLSVFHEQQRIIDPLNPYRVLRRTEAAASVFKSPIRYGQTISSVKGGQKGQRGSGTGGHGMAGSERRSQKSLDAKAKKRQQASAARSARLESYRKSIAPIFGEEAAEKVMAEYDRRQALLMGVED